MVKCGPLHCKLEIAGRSRALPDIFPLSVPDEPATEIENFVRYASGRSGSHMLLDYALREVKARERVVTLHESGWVAVVPYWAAWPFEILRECVYFDTLR